MQAGRALFMRVLEACCSETRMEYARAGWCRAVYSYGDACCRVTCLYWAQSPCCRAISCLATMCLKTQIGSLSRARYWPIYGKVLALTCVEVKTCALTISHLLQKLNNFPRYSLCQTPNRVWFFYTHFSFHRFCPVASPASFTLTPRSPTKSIRTLSWV